MTGVERTRAAIRARRDARIAELAPVISELQAAGVETLRELATALNERGIPAARGGKWSAGQVRRLLEEVMVPE